MNYSVGRVQDVDRQGAVAATIRLLGEMGYAVDHADADAGIIATIATAQTHGETPPARGLLGRTAGTEPGFAYSEAMAASGLVWTRDSLERFLEAPFEALPGTAMGYDGIKDAQERADLIAYLAAVSNDPALCP